jgi:hypothetical protein
MLIRGYSMEVNLPVFPNGPVNVGIAAGLDSISAPDDMLKVP